MTRRSVSPPPDPGIRRRSVVGCDAGLVTFGLAHVERREPLAIEGSDGAPWYELRGGMLTPPYTPSTGVYLARAPDRTARETVAEQTAHRVHELSDWLRPRLAAAVGAGAEVVAAERYEHVREASSAAKAAAGHAALVLDCARLDPRPSAQAAGCGCPAYYSARGVKRAVTGCDVAGKRVVRRAVERLVAGARERLAALRVEDAAHLADACAVALRALGHSERPLLVGEYLTLAAFTPVLAAFDVRERRPEPEQLDGRAVLVAGSAARRDLKLAAGPPLVWREERVGEARFMAALVPGAQDRSWKSAESARRARLFLRAAARPT